MSASTPHYSRNCCHNDLCVAKVAKLAIDQRLGHTTQDLKEENLSRGDGYIKILPFETGDYECVCVLSGNRNDYGISPRFLKIEAFREVFKNRLDHLICNLF